MLALRLPWESTVASVKPLTRTSDTATTPAPHAIVVSQRPYLSSWGEPGAPPMRVVASSGPTGFSARASDAVEARFIVSVFAAVPFAHQPTGPFAACDHGLTSAALQLGVGVPTTGRPGS
jgi:hypothetical protein